MSRCSEYGGLSLLLISEEILDGIGIECTPVFFNCVSDWFGMLREEERRHVDQIMCQVKIAAHIIPTQECRGSLTAGEDLRISQSRSHSNCANHVPGSHEEISPIHDASSWAAWVDVRGCGRRVKLQFRSRPVPSWSQAARAILSSTLWQLTKGNLCSPALDVKASS
jgi:hypothetical protein